MTYCSKIYSNYYAEDFFPVRFLSILAKLQFRFEFHQYFKNLSFEWK